MTVTIDEDYRITAVEDIRNIVSENGALTGSAVSTADATTNTVSEILKITVIAVVFVLFVLLLTTTSWVEPFLVLIGLGVAIMLNNGSNLIFGEISFVTGDDGIHAEEDLTVTAGKINIGVLIHVVNLFVKEP